MIGHNLLSDDLAGRFNDERQQVLIKFCNFLTYENVDSDLLDNYFTNIKIPNGLCVFDLLRFYDKRIVNILVISIYFSFFF